MNTLEPGWLARSAKAIEWERAYTEGWRARLAGKSLALAKAGMSEVAAFHARNGWSQCDGAIKVGRPVQW